MKHLLYFFILCLTSVTFGQSSSMQEQEDILESLLSKLRDAQSPSEKSEANNLFKAEMFKTLENDAAFDYSFSKLKTVGFIDGPDKQMRIVNWNVEQEDLGQKYYCFVVHIDKRKKTQYITELIDVSFGMPSQPSEILTSDQWYGALYYKIIPVKKGSKTIYTLLGWDHNSSMSQIKLIDAMYFTGKTVKLGYPIFKMGKETKKRVFFEHSKKATMYLNYEANRGRIMMDHLSPESPSMKNFRSFYVPDLSYDAFELKDSKWILIEDVVAINDTQQEKKQVIYVKDPKTGKVVKKEVKTKWQNPNDPDNPNGGTEHVAVTPESEKNKKIEENDEVKDKLSRKDRKNAKKSSIFNGIKKR